MEFFEAKDKLKSSLQFSSSPLAQMGTASFPAPSFGQERYSGQQEKAPKKKTNLIEILSSLNLDFRLIGI